MNKISLLKKILIYLFIFIFLIIAIYKLTPNNTKETIKAKIIKQLPPKYHLILRILFRDRFDDRNLKNDYNVRLLPWTQFVELDFKEKFFDFDLKNSKNRIGGRKDFFLEIINDDVWVIDSEGSVRKINFNDIANDITEKIKTLNIQSNLKKKIIVINTYVHDKKIYFSYLEYKDSCETLNIIFAEINNESLNFQNFYNSTECGEAISGGRMQFFEHNNMNGLLVTSGTAKAGEPSEKIQDDNSIFGKILFINFKTKKLLIFQRDIERPRDYMQKKI